MTGAPPTRTPITEPKPHKIHSGGGNRGNPALRRVMFSPNLRYNNPRLQLEG